LDAAIFGGFHLGARQGETSLKSLQQVIVVPSMTIIAQNFDARLHGDDNGSWFDVGYTSSCFLVNARKASRVKRLCGSFATGPGSL
jgi:hypothetical protein